MNMRIYHTIRLCMILSSGKRTQYMKDKKIFRQIGDNVSIMSRKIPLYPNLISFHNNINIGSNVQFLTHDSISKVVNRMPHDDDKKAHEMLGCIEIMDNVYVGAGAYISSGVRIGPNAIVSAGSVVTKDVLPNSVVAGNPAKVVGSVEIVSKLRRGVQQYPDEMTPQMGTVVSDELADFLWDDFYKKRNKQNKKTMAEKITGVVKGEAQ